MTEDVPVQVWRIAEPLLESEGMEIFDIEFRREHSGLVLRLFVDRTDGQGVTLNELSHVSRQLSDLLDVHDIVPGSYTLEVSSPGINRRLRRPDHFRRYIGQRVQVRTSEAIEGRRSFSGVLEEVDFERIRVRDAAGDHWIRFEQIARANLIVEP
ncbi:MAG: ribosome maturation factor RimP [Candidatus Binatia bacterium]|nr:ribosome maturation factor RimP [Candidatus Binatia bacterium]